ncbi:hypothetical protein F4780DRAFT_528112 [Xylariomycetidae sp. FL0641]|nr:hypothetical protein F4780DRAFT_528112 [Xylariomycetidae sp. FL0641]
METTAMDIDVQEEQQQQQQQQQEQQQQEQQQQSKLPSAAPSSSSSPPPSDNQSRASSYHSSASHDQRSPSQAAASPSEAHPPAGSPPPGNSNSPQPEGLVTTYAHTATNATAGTNGINPQETPAAPVASSSASTPPASDPAPPPAPVAPMGTASPPMSRTVSLPNATSLRQDVPHPALRVATANDTSKVPRSFPSPRSEKYKEPPNFDADVQELESLLSRVSPAAARHCVRNRWDTTLLGSEFHQSFILNAVVHHASEGSIQRAIGTFGGKMVSKAQREFIGHFQARDLDKAADLIIAKASNTLLDKALDKRLKTIDARSLINALARAERLGYESSDVIEDNKQPSLASAPNNPPPAPAPAPAPAPTYAPAPSMPMPMPTPTPVSMPTAFQASQAHRFVAPPSYNPPSPVVVQQRPSPAVAQPQQPRPPMPPQQVLPRHPAQAPAPSELQCRMCWRKFTSTTPYEYHVARQLCSKQPPKPEGFPWSCDHCGAGFITKVGQTYHAVNKVCGDHSTAPATPRPAASGSPMNGVSAPPVNTTPVHSTAAIPSPSSRPPNSSQPRYVQTTVTPGQANYPPPATPHTDPDDPYGHLTAEQRAQLCEELRQAEEQFKPRFAEVQKIADPETRKVQTDHTQNCFSTKQSIIRKKYGVRLRRRRTRAEIDSERIRIGSMKHRSVSSHAPETPSMKRQRTDNAQQPNYAAPSNITAPLPRIDYLSVADMNNAGLSGANATAATTDPTAAISLAKPAASQLPPAMNTPPPQNSLSSLQKKGYRVSSHTPGSNQAHPPSTAPAQRSGSASEPVVLEDDSDSDDGSGSDGDIPASLPSTRPLNPPPKSLVM